MTRSYDLIVIGAGMAGVAAANKCASQGWNVAIIDALPYGGTCALRGWRARQQPRYPYLRGPLPLSAQRRGPVRLAL